MTQRKHGCRNRSLVDRQRSVLVAWILIGSVLGAVFSCLASQRTAFSFGTALSDSPMRVFLRSAIFPACMLIALITGKRFLFYLLFCFSAFITAFSLCFVSANLQSLLIRTVSRVLFCVILPFPVFLSVSAEWCGALLEASDAEHLLILPALAAAMFGALLESLFLF